MSNYTAAFLVTLVLVLIAIRNGVETDRGIICVAVLWCTWPGYLIYHTELYFEVVDIIGSYAFQCLTPLLAVFILSFMRDKLSTVLMLLFTVLILANGYFFWLEGIGYQVQKVQQAFVWFVFFIEVALMLSQRLTNGIHGAVQRLVIAGGVAKNWSSGDDSHAGSTNNSKKAAS